jgi:uncharacterized protein YdeI (YjbR/CyaY-like superfamily)
METILKTDFEALTPGGQRAYIFCFSEPKQSKTRVSRNEKIYTANSQWKGIIGKKNRRRIVA